MSRYFLAVLLVTPLSLSPLRAQETKKPADALDGPPFVTCKAWAIADGKTGKLLWGDNEKTPRAMASTTKIMTAWIVLQLAADDPKVLEEMTTFSERADKTSGSTADIKAGERLTIGELLYGLLLPSGNDAAVGLAEHFGNRFPSAQEEKSEDAVARFIAEMNRRAQKMEMKETKYIDTNGLGANQTSARDLLRLTWTGLQDPRFRKYVETRSHSCELVQADSSKRKVTWKNTNQLLDIEGYDGVKTGTTNAAGACLVCSAHRGSDQLLVVVLGSTSGDARYVDSRNLLRWAWLQRGHKPADKDRR